MQLKKICTACSKNQTLGQFHKKSSGLMGVNSICKKCVSKTKKKSFASKKEAKEKKKRIRFTLLDIKSFRINFVPQKEEASDLNKITVQLIESINNYYLTKWDLKWESKQQLLQPSKQRNKC